jgi:hypothetical protein
VLLAAFALSFIDREALSLEVKVTEVHRFQGASLTQATGCSAAPPFPLRSLSPALRRTIRQLFGGPIEDGIRRTPHQVACLA